MTSTMEGHIVIGVVQLLTALLQTVFHKESKKTAEANKETLQRIELVLNLNGNVKKEPQ